MSAEFDLVISGVSAASSTRMDFGISEGRIASR